MVDIKVSDAEQLGDCIDCTICVQVCPTGIDIRNGLQYECIACGACIDACDEVMDKLGYPKGLVRYTTHNALVGHKVNLFRPRIIIYAVLLLLLLAGTITGIAIRKPILVDVMRDKQLYRLAEDGAIENSYTLRLINKTGKNYDVDLHVEVGDVDAELIINDLPIHLGAESVITLPVTVRAPANCVSGMKEIEFKLTDKKSDLKVEEESRFFGPTDAKWRAVMTEARKSWQEPMVWLMVGIPAADRGCGHRDVGHRHPIGLHGYGTVVSAARRAGTGAQQRR